MCSPPPTAARARLMQPQHHHVATHSCSPPPANSSRLRSTRRRGRPACPSRIGRSASPSAGGAVPPAGRGPMGGGTAPGRRQRRGAGRGRRGGGAAAAGAGAGRAAAPAPWRPRPRPRGGPRRSAAFPTTRTARKRGGSRGAGG